MYTLESICEILTIPLFLSASFFHQLVILFFQELLIGLNIGIQVFVLILVHELSERLGFWSICAVAYVFDNFPFLILKSCEIRQYLCFLHLFEHFYHVLQVIRDLVLVVIMLLIVVLDDILLFCFLAHSLIEFIGWNLWLGLLRCYNILACVHFRVFVHFNSTDSFASGFSGLMLT